MSASGSPYRLHGFDVSYFTAKVRPALRAKGLFHAEQRADIRQLLRRTGLPFIPVLETPEGEWWQDSTEILERLEARHPEPPLFPPGPLQRLAAQLVNLYVDEVALLPAMHYRWGSELGESSARARFSAMLGSRELGNRAADQMAGARLALGATDATAPAIEAHTRDLLAALSEYFESSPYLLGERMSWADCALMGPFYAHLWGDLVSRRLLLETALPVVGWIERCSFPDASAVTADFGEDHLPPGLRRVLAVMGCDGAPVVLAAAKAVEAWAERRPDDGERLPRAVGPCRSPFRDAELEQAARPFTLLSLGRVIDAHDALGAADRARVDAALAGSGFEALLAQRPRHRLSKSGYQLVLVPA